MTTTAIDVIIQLNAHVASKCDVHDIVTYLTPGPTLKDCVFFWYDDFNIIAQGRCLNVCVYECCK